MFRGVAESMHGFKKNIAIKRILPSLTKNKKFVAMFLDEARLSLVAAAREHRAGVRHRPHRGHVLHRHGVRRRRRPQGAARMAAPHQPPHPDRARALHRSSRSARASPTRTRCTTPRPGAPLGIVHRDISPPNVLISKQGEVKVVDFGLAKATSQVETTDPGVVKGKMSYLSPEAARGEEVDSRADIFAVGILLYELLTGKRLFYGETDYQTVELVRNAKIPPIKPQNPQVEPELEDIVRKALAKRKEDRYQNATDIQDALAQYSLLARPEGHRARHRRAGAPVPGRPAHAVGRGQAEDQHHRSPAAGRDRQVHLGRRRGAGRGRAPAVGRRAGAALGSRNVPAAPVGRRLHRSARPGPRSG